MIVPDYKDTHGNWVRSKRVKGKAQFTISGSKWAALTNRCKEGGSLQRDFPAYIGCINGFKDFNSFTDWHVNQIGYGKGYELDKDLLQHGNKVYNEETCLLIPKDLNLFFGKHTRARGIYPQGIDMNYSNPGKYRAQVRVENKSQHIGYYFSLEAAKEAYVKEKTKYARILADKYDGVIDPRAILALRTKEFVYEGLDCIFV